MSGSLHDFGVLIDDLYRLGDVDVTLKCCEKWMKMTFMQGGCLP